MSAGECQAATAAIASGEANPFPSADAQSDAVIASRVALKQVAGIFDAIATAATEIDLSFYHLDPEKGEARELSLRLIRGLAERIGWMADLGTGKLPGWGIGMVRGGAEEWLLSPANLLSVGVSEGPSGGAR